MSTATTTTATAATAINSNSTTTAVIDSIPLICSCQQYNWGKYGSTSAVAKLAFNGGSINTIIESQPYAELWMGTHSTVPSKVKTATNNEILLSTYLNNTELPYLFKVLSIRTALSIQAHPDKLLAEQLNKNNPKEYRDSNHKPELACAVTNFSAMCGFRPINEILDFIHTVPELAAIIGPTAINQLNQAIESNQSIESIKLALKAVFAAVMTVSTDLFTIELNKLLLRINTERLIEKWNNNNNKTAANSSSRDLNVFELIVTLSEQYPADIGIFCPFLLNSFYCVPGESIFLAANEPHAYINGDIIEVMACSDNVVRAGLTPKFRDTDILIQMLNYTIGKPNINNGTVSTVDPNTIIYSAPVPEFKLRKTIINTVNNNILYNLEILKSHSIILVYNGIGIINNITVKSGSIILIPANQSVSIQSTATDIITDLVLFRCSANDEY